MRRALRSLPPGGKNWLLAAEHDVNLLIQALQLMPAPSPDHGLEAFMEYLQQVRERLHDQPIAATGAIPADSAAPESADAEDFEASHISLQRVSADSDIRCDPRAPGVGDGPSGVSETPSQQGDVEVAPTAAALQSAASSDKSVHRASSAGKEEDALDPGQVCDVPGAQVGAPVEEPLTHASPANSVVKAPVNENAADSFSETEPAREKAGQVYLNGSAAPAHLADQP